jgi:hypothetical protein
MKRILVVILMLLTTTTSIHCLAQKTKNAVLIPTLPIDSTTKLIAYTKVVEVNGVRKEELFHRALLWANSYYKNPADVIREKDSINGKILCKARFKIYNEADKKGIVTDAGDVMYNLTIQVKENRYRYELTKFNWQQISAFPAERWLNTKSEAFIPAYAFYLTELDEKAKEVISSLQDKMKAVNQIKKDDW